MSGELEHRKRGRPRNFDENSKEYHLYLYPDAIKKVAESRGEGESWNHTFNRLIQDPCPGILSHLPYDLREKVSQETRQTGETPNEIIKKILRQRYAQPAPAEKPADDEKLTKNQQKHQNFEKALLALPPGRYDRETLKQLMAKSFGGDVRDDRFKERLYGPIANGILCQSHQYPYPDGYLVNLRTTCPLFTGGNCKATGKPCKLASRLEECPTLIAFQHRRPEADKPAQNETEAEKNGQNTPTPPKTCQHLQGETCTLKNLPCQHDPKDRPDLCSTYVGPLGRTARGEP